MKSWCEVYRGRRTLVLGASGFVGRWVARGLADCGAHVLAAGRDAAALEQALHAAGLAGRYETVLRDLALGGIADWLRPLEADVVFNLAGYGVERSERDEARAQRINAALVAELASAVHGAPGSWPYARLLHTGSALEYGVSGGVLREDSATQPTTLYGATKLAGVLALVRQSRASRTRAVVARLFTVYGPGEHAGRLLPSILDGRDGRRTVHLSAGTQLRDFTYVEDVAEGLLRLGVADAEPGTVVNLATGVMQPVREFAEVAARVVGMSRELLNFGALRPRAEEMLHTGVSVDRLLALCDGWRPSPDIASGVARTLARQAQESSAPSESR
ncbi:MAG: NAD-dependent epimerase/dehydratase family protein [Gemmatimonadaceae bacterium]